MSLMAERLFKSNDLPAAPVAIGPAHDHHTEIDLGGLVDDKIGSRLTILGALSIFSTALAANLGTTPHQIAHFIALTPDQAALQIPFLGAVLSSIGFATLPEQVFVLVGVAGGVFIGPALSSSRTLMARLAPPGQVAEFFGLYNLTGRATAFLAPTTIGLMTQTEINLLEKFRSFTLVIDNEPVIIGLEDVDLIAEDIPGWSVANKDNLTVALDVTVTTELQEEGNARELVNRIQKIRKESGYEVTDRIKVDIQEYEPFKSAIINYSDYICAEILADTINIVPKIDNGIVVEINDIMINVLISKTSE